MSRQYYYGLEDQEIYSADDPYQVFEEIEGDYDEQEMIDMIIVEMVVSRKSGMRWCMEDNIFIEYYGHCGLNCEDYEPRNGKSGICKHQSWGLIETGRKWEITGKDQLRKISGRKQEDCPYDYCMWFQTNSEDERYYETSCGEAQQFMTAGISENKYKFCPYCGRRILSFFMEGI